MLFRSETLIPGTDPAIVAAANGFLSIFIVQNASAAVPAEPASRSYAARTGPSLTISPRRIRLTGDGLASIRVGCQSIGETTCRTTLELQADGGVLVGSGRFKVRPGTPRTVRLRTTIDARQRSDGQRRGSIRLRATLVAKDALRNSSRLARWVTVTY